mgnify:CR=1 FL=1|jgi:hypothetical protein
MATFNRNLTLVYPPGAGGEFLGWAISTFPGFNQVTLCGVSKNNKWSWDPAVHGKGISMESTDRVNHEFIDNDKINVNRDHGECIFYPYERISMIDTFLDIYYDRWGTAGFIVITDLSGLAPQLSMLKNNKTTGAYNYFLERFGNRNCLTIDISEIVLNDGVSDKIATFIYNVFNVSINPSVLGWLIDAWNQKNVT